MGLVTTNPSLYAAKKKQATAAKKAHPVKQSGPTEEELFRQEIDHLRTELYGRATWAALQKVKQESDETAGNVKIVMLAGGGIGFLLGCVVAGVVMKQRSRSQDLLKIT